MLLFPAVSIIGMPCSLVFPEQGFQTFSYCRIQPQVCWLRQGAGTRYTFCQNRCLVCLCDSELILWFLLLVSNCFSGVGLSNLSDKFYSVSPRGALMSSDSGVLVIPKVRTKICSSLILELTCGTDSHRLRKLKIHLFILAFSWHLEILFRLAF